ncbi:GNAT family N-acetyltransferase [Kibdelosporangium aridum]|uniref:GNAT family N-acetyltransferase n=1 Tax=Kibdelosporangium aridum TaxID=2030 RepID=A0A428YPN5_KIBAR|nr:GNAT family N-acetyltransferase [Kibdelosporangium aridum]RSM70296.1 GNAT family N-acetyltransferase [Kibdelosporangium aridum]
MQIRRVPADERQDFLPLEYAFNRSPLPEDERTKMWDERRAYVGGNLNLVAEEDGEIVAEGTSIPMRQNVRGSVYPMAGIAAVAAQPHVRRKGHIRALLTELFGQVRDEGHVLTALYPFRASFYGRFGFVGVPKARTARFSPADLGHLLRADLPGTTEWQQIGTGFPLYREFLERLLPQRHGFSVFPDFRDAGLRDKNEYWLLTAKSGDEIIGASMYRITDHGETLKARNMLYTSPLGRALLLQFYSRHVDHVAEVEVTVAPDEFPELWSTDLAVHVEARVSFPTGGAPMGRVLSVEALQGMQVGAGRVGIEIVDDEFIAGKYMLDGTSGQLEVTSGDPTVTLTAAGFSGLVYGALSPEDIAVRGFGSVPAEAIPELAKLFPRNVPYFFSEF